MSDSSDWKKDIDESEKKFKEDTEQAIEKLDELQSDWEKSREQAEENERKRKEQMEHR